MGIERVRFGIFNFIRKTIAIFLIILAGFNSFGLFFFYWGKIQLCKIKAEDFADNYYALPEKSLTIFSKGAEDFQFNNEHEIIFKGKLFDIVKVEVSNGKTLYYTLIDDDEDLYTEKLADWAKSDPCEKSLPGKTVSLHIGKYFYLKKLISAQVTQLRIHLNVRYSNDYFFYTPPSLLIFSPPPDNLC